MAWMTWQAKLAAARTEKEVVDVARDYLARLEYFEVQRLPERCRPRKILTANDLAAYAFDLVRHEYDEDDAHAPFIHKLAAFFAQASLRLSQVTMRTNDGDGTMRYTA